MANQSSETFRLKLSAALHRLLADAAKLDRRSMSDFVRIAIEDRVKAIRQAAGRKP
jgi:predicted HicB family RNase H-like nuclease